MMPPHGRHTARRAAPSAAVGVFGATGFATPSLDRMAALLPELVKPAGYALDPEQRQLTSFRNR